MQVDSQETKGAAKWFAFAGLAAVTFSLALYLVDQGLSHSTRERDLGQTLRELRTAQTSLASSKTVDPRQSGEIPAN